MTLRQSSTSPVPAPLVDTSLLPPAKGEFIVLADTHDLALDTSANSETLGEFPSRSLQADRVSGLIRVLQDLTGAGGPPIIHLGDLVQLYPGQKGHKDALRRAVGELKRVGADLHVAAGNHDVGDKPDPSSPAPHVSRQSLQGFDLAAGRSWHDFEMAGCHFILLNASLLNADLAAARDQEWWVASKLSEAAGKRIIVALHYPLFLADPSVSGIGRYDVVADPARSRLMRLFQEHRVSLVLSGHTHFAFWERRDGTDYFTANSTTFSRPGFPEIFSAAPPPERGRDDRAKLGFYLGRVRDRSIDLHFIRTAGRTADEMERLPGALIVSRLPRDLPASPLGLVATHPLTSLVELPAAWPSIGRQPAKNAHPALLVTELGSRWIRVPISDASSDLQSAQLDLLASVGTAMCAYVILDADVPAPTFPSAAVSRCETLEIALPSLDPPHGVLRSWIGQARAAGVSSVAVSSLTKRSIPGRQHPRAALGTAPEDLDRLDGLLAEEGLCVDRTLCRLDSADEFVERIAKTMRASDRLGILDWIFALDPDPISAAIGASKALLAMAARPGARLFIEPLLALDRTMDESCGVLDRAANPTAVGACLRTLNNIVYAEQPRWGCHENRDGVRFLQINKSSTTCWLVVPADAPRHVTFKSAESGRAWSITRPTLGLRQTDRMRSQRVEIDVLPNDGPLLVEGPMSLRPVIVGAY